MVLANQVNKVFLEGVIRHVKCCSSSGKRLKIEYCIKQYEVLW